MRIEATVRLIIKFIVHDQKYLIPFIVLVGDNSPRPKKKSEIRTLLDNNTQALTDSNKPQWMMFRAQNHSPPSACGIDNPGFERQESEEQDLSSVLPWKRDDNEMTTTGDQDSLPAYVRNSEYVTHSSPSNRALVEDQKKRNAILGYFQKRDSLTFLGDLADLDGQSSARRNSKEGMDFLSVLANPVNIRKSSAPPLNRQISLSSLKVLCERLDYLNINIDCSSKSVKYKKLLFSYQEI